MREIKFMLYNKELNEMSRRPYTVEELAQTGNTALTNEVMMENIIFRQFTGVLDKNGVEIYEGDVIKATIEFDGETNEYVGKVIFQEAMFLIKTKTTYLTFEETKFSKDTFEVLGNIHQNHELLQ